MLVLSLLEPIGADKTGADKTKDRRDKDRLPADQVFAVVARAEAAERRIGRSSGAQAQLLRFVTHSLPRSRARPLRAVGQSVRG
ncbi:MAG: hypothetical protein ACRDYA_16965, partial [Egibacteraceae bacterium]